MRRSHSHLLAVVVVFAVGAAIAYYHAPAAAQAEKSADEMSVEAAVTGFVGTLQKGDAKAVAALWTATGEYVGPDGSRLRGRADIEKAYAEHFAKRKDRSLTLGERTVRFLGKDAAVVDTTARVASSGDEPGFSTDVNLLMLREDGQWKVAILRESEREYGDATPLQELAWMVGSWSASGEERSMTITYAFDEGKKFLMGHFAIKEKGKEAGKGFQLIAQDPATGMLRSWVFESNGGFGEGYWTKEEKRWVVEATGTLPDGQSISAVNILVPQDKDHYTWQSIERFVGDFAEPDTAPIKVSRVKSAE